jgi:hypothetical protein
MEIPMSTVRILALIAVAYAAPYMMITGVFAYYDHARSNPIVETVQHNGQTYTITTEWVR